MQVKKEEVRDKLLDAGHKVFSEVGYEKASLRKIVKEAGTTLGNFYNYFDGKEALYDGLVGEEYTKFMYFIHHHDDLTKDRPDDLWDINDVSTWSTVLNEYMGQIIPVFSEKFLLLIDKSEGTKYESFKVNVIDFFEEHYLEHVQNFGDGKDNGYGRIVSTMFVEGLIKLIKLHLGTKKLGEMIIKHFVFFAVGTMGLIKFEKEDDR